MKNVHIHWTGKAWLVLDVDLGTIVANLETIDQITTKAREESWKIKGFIDPKIAKALQDKQDLLDAASMI